MKKFSYWLIAIVVAMVLLNAIMLYMLWQKRQGRADPPASAKAYLEKELKLTDAQKQQYDKMRNQHFQFTRSINQENRRLREHFFDGIKDSTVSSAQGDSVAQLIANNQMRIDTATLHHFKQFRAILTTEQKAHFDKIIQNVLHMMAGPHPPRGGGMGGPPNGLPPGQGGPMDGPPPGPGGEGPPEGGPPQQ